MKYLVAWDNVYSNILADSAFFSQAHLLEASTDIDACVEMAAQFYYKQSFQILRGFLENAVLPVHFCDQPNEFEKWRSNNYRTPQLRGKDGLLNRLEKSGLITNELNINVSDLYRQLNGSIHGGEKYLIHKGVHKNAWSGLLFKEQDFLDWCTAISKSVEVGIKLLQIILSAVTTGSFITSILGSGKEAAVIGVVLRGVRWLQIPGRLKTRRSVDFDFAKTAGCREFHKVTAGL